MAVSPAAIILLVLVLYFFARCSSYQHIKLKFQPAPEDPQSSLIWFNRTSAEDWSQVLDNYLEVYRSAEHTECREENLVECDYVNPPDEHGDEVCDIDVEKFGPCVASNYFGYKNLKPCVFIELETPLEWKPSFFNGSKSLPKRMSPLFKADVEEYVTHPKMWWTLWLECRGEAVVDEESLGPVKYYPGPGYPYYHFPPYYSAQNGYLNPLIAVQLPALQSGLVVSVECKVWSPNIWHNYHMKMGIVTFQILMDV